jgi:hypothetical protein
LVPGGAIHPGVAWDSNRPVPWKRLIKEWAIYAGIMAVILIVVFRDGGRLLPILGGLIVSGPIYLVFGAVLAKFGYQRKTLAELRTPRAAPGGSTDSTGSATRVRPAPTRRTSTGPSNRPRSKRR